MNDPNHWPDDLQPATRTPAALAPGRARIGLALGSGSARGWAHLGVIRELEAAGLVPDVVAGSSVGALVGAAYAGGQIERFEEWARGLRWHDVLSFFDVGFSGGLIKGEKLMAFVAEQFVGVDFAGLGRPFACVATDLHTGHEVWLREGAVVDAVRASIALPGLFSPAVIDGRLLADGGLVNPVPVSLCRALGADIVIAVDLGSDLVGRHLKPNSPATDAPPPEWLARVRGWLGDPAAGSPESHPAVRHPTPMRLPSMLDVMATSINIMQVRIARSRLAGEPADVLVAPQLAEFGMLDYDQADAAIAEGREAVRLMLPMIERVLLARR